MNQSAIIRKATQADFEALKSLFLEFYLQYNLGEVISEKRKPFILVHDVDKFASETITMFLSEYETYVAQYDEVIIGYISGKIRTRENYVLDREGYIEDWFVTKAHRGKRIGTLLYETMMHYFQTEKCNVLVLEAFTDNTRAIKSYEEMGYVVEWVGLKKKI